MESDFEEVGISSALDRLKIMLFLSHLKPEEGRATEFSKKDVVQCFRSESAFRQYAEMLDENDINGEILLKCTPSVLQEIGVKTILEASKIIVFFGKCTGENKYDHDSSKEKLISKIQCLDDKDKDEFLNIIEKYNLNLRILEVGGKNLLAELGIKKQKVLKKLF